MSKKALPVAVFGARPANLQADTPSPRALECWNPGLQARAASATDDSGPFSIDVLDVIGEDYWTGGGVTGRKLSALLRSAGDREIVVNINSPGGNVFEGLTIYNMLREHAHDKSVPVTVRVLGMAASAASIIAMAGSEVQIAKAGFLLIHNCWGVDVGDRHEKAKTVEYMAMIDEMMAEIYAARSGLPQAEIVAMMDADTTITGKAAVSKGFADSHLASDELTMSFAAHTEPDHIQAQRRLDATLARGGMPRSERRALVKSLTNSGTPSAAGDEGTPSAAAQSAFASLLAEVKSAFIVT